MQTIRYTTSTTKEDLTGILDLQKANLLSVLTKEETLTQGFVTVIHSYGQLEKLNSIEQHIIAKQGNTIIAYVLAMTEHSKSDIPILIPMFNLFDKLFLNGRPISGYNYLLVGQACVDKKYRGQGILDHCYAAYKKKFAGKYDFAITEIASANVRSRNAHKRIGFKEIHRYYSNDKTEWCIVLWNWKEISGD
jgi:hypothetical protein